MVEGDITIDLKRPEIFILLIILATIFVMELQVGLKTPISFGDEGFHTRMAQLIAQNKEYYIWVPLTQNLISKTAFERPPLWNMLEAGFFYIFGFNEVIVKFLTPFISLMSGIAVYLTAKTFYNKHVGFIASILLVTIPSFVTYSIFFYTDMLNTFFVIMFLFMFSLSTKTGRRLHMLTAGTFAALSVMTKITGYVLYGVVAIVLFYYFVKEKKGMSLIKKYSPMLLMMILIPSTFFVRNYIYYGTPTCYTLPFISIVTDRIFDFSGCVVSSFEPQYEYAGRTDMSGTEASVFRIGLMNYLSFAYGNIWLIVFSMFAGMFLIANRLQDSDETNVMNILLLVMLSIFFIAFLTMTNRSEDTARYTLMWAPVISIVAAIYLEKTYSFIGKYQKHVALIVFVVIIVYSLFGFRFLDFKKEGKYRGFGIIDKLSGLRTVKQFSPSFFEACDWIKENTPEDSLISTVWTHRTAYSCQRRVSGSSADMTLSNDVDHILSTAEGSGITHIFVQKFSLSSEALSEKYPISYVQLLDENTDYFEKIFENGPSLDQCIQQGGCDGNVVFRIIKNE